MVIISKEEESFIEHNASSKSLYNKDFLKKDIHLKTKTIPKYFYLVLITYIILLLINSISCESYIILKINIKAVSKFYMMEIMKIIVFISAKIIIISIFLIQ